MLRSFVARRALEGGPVAVAGDLAEQAATDPALVSQGGHPLWRTNVTICLIEAERYEVAEQILSPAAARNFPRVSNGNTENKLGTTSASMPNSARVLRPC